MHLRSVNASTGSLSPPADIDDALWEKIDAAVGGPILLDTAVLIEDASRLPAVMVVVVERARFPCEEELCRRFRLTPRESEVARLLADRFSDEEIARRLDIRLNTARCHSHRVLRKLGVHSRNDVRTALLKGETISKRPSAREVA
jgi:DNA-binding NarL/FixJ family response regulator